MAQGEYQYLVVEMRVKARFKTVQIHIVCQSNCDIPVFKTRKKNKLNILFLATKIEFRSVRILRQH